MHNCPGDPRLAGLDENSDGTNYEARERGYLEIVSTGGLRDLIALLK